MTQKKEKSAIKNNTHLGPTPTLGKPSRDKQIFTYSENKLLDQITTELMQAWAKDLSIIKRHHNWIVETSTKAKSLTETLEEEFPRIEEFLKSNDFLIQFSNVQDTMKRIEGLYATLQKDMNDHWLTRPSKTQIEDLLMKIGKIDGSVKTLLHRLEKKEKKPWWKKIF